MPRKTIFLSILSPEKTVFEGDVRSVRLPGSAGSFTILPHHAPIVSSLKKGVIIYKTGDGEQSIEIESGFVEKSDEKVSVCIS